MSLNIEKKQINTQTTPLSPQQTDTGAVSTSQKPIDFTSEETKNKQNTKGIAVEKSATTEGTQTSTAQENTTTPLESKNTTVEKTSVQNSAEEQTSSAKEPETKEKSELDNKLEEYSKKNNLENIDEVRASLISKKRDGTLTQDEKKLLLEIDKPEKLISNERLNSAEWKSKSPKEKLNEYVRAYLERFDDSFSTANKKDQNKKIQYQIKEFKEYINISNAVYSDAEFKNIGALIEKLNEKSIDFQEFKNQNYANFQNQLVPAERRQTEEWRSLSPQEKLTEYVEGYCSKTIKGFSDIKDKKQRAEIVEKTIQSFAEKFVGKERYAKLSEGEKDTLFTKAAIYFDAIDSSGYTIEQYFEMSPAEQGNLIKNYYDKNKEQLGEFPKEQQAKLDLVNEYSAKHDGKEPTNLDLYKMLQGKKELSEGEKALKNEYDILFQIDAKARTQKTEITVSLNEQASVNGFKTSREFVAYSLGKLENKNSKESAKELHKLLKSCNSPQEMEMVVQLAKDNGFSEEIINKAMPKEDMSRHLAHSMAISDGKGFNMATDFNMKYGDVKVQMAATRIVPAHFQGETLNSVATNTATYKELITPLTQGLNDRTLISYQNAQSCSVAVLNSSNVPSANKAVFAQDLITNAKVNGAQEQLNFAKAMSQINDPAVTEGLAAASKSVDKSVRAEYNSYVEAAAKNYPPAEQEKISKAMRTGEISQETMTKTTPEAAKTQSKDTKADNKQQQTTSNKETKSTTAQAQTNTKGTTTQSSSRSSNSAIKSDIQSAYSSSVRTSQSSAGATTHNSVTSQKTSSTKEYTNSDSSSVTSTKQTDETAQLEAKRDEVAQNALNTSNHIKESVAEHETEKILDSAIKQTVETITDDKEFQTSIENNQIIEIRNKLKNASSITEVYDIISSLGEKAQSVFFDRITKSKYLNSFIENIDDTSTLLKLYNSSNSEDARKIVLEKLGDKIYTLLENDKISDDNLVSVNYKILKNYLTQNVSSMSNMRFSRYLQFLPLDEREKLTKLRNKAKGTDTQVSSAKIQNNAQPQNTQTQVPATQQPDTKKQPQTQPKLAANEMTKTLANGTTITRQGTAFGGISDVEDESYRVVSQQELAQQKGDPIGMNDEILTPGSIEWQQKYNKQQAPQHTAFTFSALEEDEDFSGTFGPAKVGMGKRINKKFPPKGFRYNA